MPEESAGSKTTATRRTVLRAAVHTAWAVPAIQIAGASPAFATTGPLPALTDLTATNHWKGANFHTSASVAYDQEAPTDLQFVFILPVSMVGDAQTVSLKGTLTDWDTACTWAHGTGAQITVTRKTNRPISVSPVSMTVELQVKKHDHTSIPIAVHASASNKSSANVAMALTAA